MKQPLSHLPSFPPSPTSEARPLIVMKFGGTSVGNAERFRQCAMILGGAARRDRVIAVVSAGGGGNPLVLPAHPATPPGGARATPPQLRKIRVPHPDPIP